ncbi:hypothetical protein QYF36_022086 [Acer negundo]|nr:hypothetical protein QYF36_022086 [Acer negundo]
MMEAIQRPVLRELIVPPNNVRSDKGKSGSGDAGKDRVVDRALTTENHGIQISKNQDNSSVGGNACRNLGKEFGKENLNLANLSERYANQSNMGRHIYVELGSKLNEMDVDNGPIIKTNYVCRKLGQVDQLTENILVDKTAGLKLGSGKCGLEMGLSLIVG